MECQEIERERKEEIMRPEKSKNCMNCRTQKIVNPGLVDSHQGSIPVEIIILFLNPFYASQIVF